MIQLIPMKSEIKPRPQSKNVRGSARPMSRHINTQQALTSFTQGKQQQEQEQFQKAIQLYLKATMYDPNYFQAYCNIGTCYRALKRFNESRKYYKKSIAIKTDDAISRYNLGNVERLLGNFEESVIHYTFVINLKEVKGVDIGGLYINTLINLGISFKNKDLYEQANQCYQKVIKINPSEESAYFNYGMSIVDALRGTDSQAFHEVTKEQAQKATKMFKKVKQLNKDSQMSEFQIIRMSILIDKCKENVTKCAEELKKMLLSEKCNLSDQINLQIAHCMKLLKNYEKSDEIYRNSIKGPVLRKRSSQNVYDTPGGFVNDGINEDQLALTEQAGLQMIDEGLYEEVRARIAKLDDSDLTKHILDLTLELTMNQESQNLNFATKIYEKNFKKHGVQIPMDQISIAGHKAIGHLLSLKKKYNESIKHFEYVGSRIKSDQQKSKVHSSLGNDYEAIGDIDRAVEEYRMALEGQPQSYELNYNIGCCFFDQQNYQQAMKHFNNFLELINKNHDTKAETKSLYVADCLISMASCKYQMQANKLNSYDDHLKAWMAVKQVREGASNTYEFEDQKILAFYLEWADILEQKLSQIGDRKSQVYISNKEMLLEVYINLLENPQCPDRDAIINNCATIYYEQKLFVNALANFNQVTSQLAVSDNNLALTYLYLHEHLLANQHIMKAADDSLDVIQNFNKGIFGWVYSFDDGDGANKYLNEKFKNKSDVATLNRLEYAKVLIDVVTTNLNKLKTGYSIEQMNKVLEQTLRKPLDELVEESEKPKIRAIISSLNKDVVRSSDKVDPNLVAICSKLSQDPQKDLNNFIKQSIDSGNGSQSVFESLLNLFIYVNRSHSQVIKKVLNKWGESHSETVSIDLDRRLTVEAQMLTIQFGEQYMINSVGDLVAHLMNWQSEIQAKLMILSKTIQKYYYKSNFKRPLECQYHFPRHVEWTQCNITYMKIAQIILQIVKNSDFIKIKGSKLKEMNFNIFNQLENQMAKKMKNKQNASLSLGDKLVPTTYYAFFSAKNDAMMFIKDLQKESGRKQEFEVSKDCKELKVIVSGILRLICIWEEPSPYMTIIRSFNDHNLPIEAQAIIGLDNDLDSLLDSSQKAKQSLELNKTLKR